MLEPLSYHHHSSINLFINQRLKIGLQQPTIPAQTDAKTIKATADPPVL